MLTFRPRAKIVPAYRPPLLAPSTGGVPSWVDAADRYDALTADFTRGLAWDGPNRQLAPLTDWLAITRASTKYALKSSGSWQSFAAGTLALTDLGLSVEEGRTGLFANPFAPATQTITVVNGTSYTASCYGSGSITLSGAASGTVAAGSASTFTAVGSSLTVTVAGTPSAVMVEAGVYKTSPIFGSRATDVIAIQGGLATALAGSQGTVIATYGKDTQPRDFQAVIGSSAAQQDCPLYIGAAGPTGSDTACGTYSGSDGSILTGALGGGRTHSGGTTTIGAAWSAGSRLFSGVGSLVSDTGVWRARSPLLGGRSLAVQSLNGSMRKLVVKNSAIGGAALQARTA